MIHNHSPGVIPYGITGHKMRPVMHMCATIGHEVPIWDQHKKFGDTDLLVRTMAQGRDLAKKLGKGGTCLMRGHGCVVVGPYLRRTVYTAVYLELNAKLQMQAEAMSKKVQLPHQGRGRARSSRPRRRPTSTAPGRTGAARSIGRIGSRPSRVTLVMPVILRRDRRRALEGWATCDARATSSAGACASDEARSRQIYNGGKFGGGTRRCDAAS